MLLCSLFPFCTPSRYCSRFGPAQWCRLQTCRNNLIPNLALRSWVYREYCGGITHPYGALVLWIIVQELLSPILTDWRLGVRNSWIQRLRGSLAMSLDGVMVLKATFSGILPCCGHSLVENTCWFNLIIHDQICHNLFSGGFHNVLL